MNVHHIGIEVSNLEKSIQFYQSFLGLHPSHSFQFQGEQIVFMDGNRITLELILTNQSMKQHPAHFAMQIDCLSEWLQHLGSLGFEPEEGPFNLNNGWKTVFYKGPDGELIEFIQA